MRSSPDHVSGTELAPVLLEDHDVRILQVRVSAEFREMPGLMVTLAQAARLFGMNPARCEQVLGALVERGELATDGRVFARADAGPRRA